MADTTSGESADPEPDEVKFDLGESANPVDTHGFVNAAYRRADDEEPPAAVHHQHEHKNGAPAKAKATDTTVAVGDVDEKLCMKPIDKEVHKLQSRIRRDVGVGVLRNALCYLFVACLVLLALNVSQVSAWPVLLKVLGLVFLLFGSVGVVLQVVHVFALLRGRSPTVLAGMLRAGASPEEFGKMLEERRAAAPYMAVDVVLKKHASKRGIGDANDWTRLSRETLKSLVFTSWKDCTGGVDEIPLPAHKACWLILVKEYRCTDCRTKEAFACEVKTFCEDTGYNDHLRRMKLKYVLDVAQGEYFPDADPHLVRPAGCLALCSVVPYTVLACLALDAVFALLFHCVTRNIGVYKIIKCMSR